MMKIKEETGASAVEFALVLPWLVLLLFGIIEFSILFYNKAMITNASREGARAGIVYSPSPITDTDVVNVVNNYCGDYLITFGVTSVVNTTISPDESSRARGDPLTVTVGYRYDFLVLPSFVSDLAGGIDLAAVTVMRME